MTDVRNTPHDPEEIELPEPLDPPEAVDETGDDDARADDDDDDLEAFADEGNDDRSADDLPVGEVEVEDDEPWKGADGPPSIDLGDHDGVDDDTRSAVADERPIAVDDADGLEVSEENESDDGGVEGTSEDISAGIDEAALPELDADEDGAFELRDLMSELAAAGFGREGETVPWIVRDDWTTGEALADVATGDGRVVAAFGDLVVLDAGARGARRARLAKPAALVALAEAAVVVGAGSTVSLVSLPSANEARSASQPPHAVLLDVDKPIRALAVANGRVWVVAGHELWVVASPPSTPKLVRSEGAIDVAAAGAQLFLLSASNGELVLERFRGDDDEWHRVHAFPAADDDSASLALSADARAIAVTSGDTLALSWDGGVTFTTHSASDVLAVCFANAGLAGGSSTEPMLVLLRDDDGTASLAARSAGAEIVVAAVDAQGLVVRLPHKDARLAWCEARDALFIASLVGSIAIGPRPSH